MIKITPETTVGELLEKTNLSMDMLQSWIDMLETAPPVVNTTGVAVLEGGGEKVEKEPPKLELIPGGKLTNVASRLQNKYRLLR